MSSLYALHSSMLSYYCLRFLQALHQFMFGAGFRLLLGQQWHNPGKKWRKLVSFNIGLHSEPQADLFCLSLEENQLCCTGHVSLLVGCSSVLSRLLGDLVACFRQVAVLAQMTLSSALELLGLCLLTSGQTCSYGLQSCMVSFKLQCTIYMHSLSVWALLPSKFFALKNILLHYALNAARNLLVKSSVHPCQSLATLLVCVPYRESSSACHIELKLKIIVIAIWFGFFVVVVLGFFLFFFLFLIYFSPTIVTGN